MKLFATLTTLFLVAAYLAAAGVPTTVTTAISGFCQNARSGRSKSRLEAPAPAKVVSFTTLTETQRGPALRHSSRRPALFGVMLQEILRNLIN